MSLAYLLERLHNLTVLYIYCLSFDIFIQRNNKTMKLNDLLVLQILKRDIT